MTRRSEPDDHELPGSPFDDDDFLGGEDQGSWESVQSEEDEDQEEERDLAAAAVAESPRDTSFVADGRDHHLSRDSITAARLVSWIRCAVLGLMVAIAIAVVVNAPLPGWIRTLAVIGGFLLMAARAFVAHAWPGLEYRFTRYRIDDQTLEIRRGVLWRTVVSVPRSRIQHTDVRRGPIERQFDLATLVVYTAGTSYSTIELSGLPDTTAFSIRDHLIAGNLDDAV